MVRGELKDLERSVLCALITISVHSRDIITALVQSNCDSRYERDCRGTLTNRS